MEGCFEKFRSLLETIFSLSPSSKSTPEIIRRAGVDFYCTYARNECIQGKL